MWPQAIPFACDMYRPNYRVFLNVHACKVTINKEQGYKKYFPENKIINTILPHSRESVL
jgi:hypothetical protein